MHLLPVGVLDVVRLCSNFICQCLPSRGILVTAGLLLYSNFVQVNVHPSSQQPKQELVIELAEKCRYFIAELMYLFPVAICASHSFIPPFCQGAPGEINNWAHSHLAALKEATAS